MALFGLTNDLDPRQIGRRILARYRPDDSTMPAAPAAPDAPADAAPTADPTDDNLAPGKITPPAAAGPGKTKPVESLPAAAPPPKGPLEQKRDTYMQNNPRPELGQLSTPMKVLDTVGQIFAPEIRDRLRYGKQSEYDANVRAMDAGVAQEQAGEKNTAELGKTSAETSLAQKRAQTLGHKTKPITIEDEQGNPVPAMQNDDPEDQNFGQVVDQNNMPVANAKIWKPTKTPHTPTAEDDTQRYLKIRTDQKMNRPVTPEDSAWAESMKDKILLTTNQSDANQDANKQVYSTDKDGKVVLTTRAEATKNGRPWEEVAPGGVKQDRDALSLMDNVQMNASNYKNAMLKINHDISPISALAMTHILSDPALDESTLTKLIGMGNAGPVMQQIHRAQEWNQLQPDERDAVTQYLRAKGSVIAYQRALTNQGRTNPEALRVEFDTIPEPYVGATVALPRFESFQQNIDQVAAKFPSNLPGLERNRTKPAAAPAAAAPAAGGQKPAKWNGKQWVDATTGQPIPTR